jgi:type I restriction enzyme S subunit
VSESIPTLANINAEELRGLPVVVPDISLEQSFAENLSQLEELTGHWSQAKERIDRLFQTLLHRGFSGDLTARWREAHMKELLAEMEHQAKALQASPGLVPL